MNARAGASDSTTNTDTASTPPLPPPPPPATTAAAASSTTTTPLQKPPPPPKAPSEGLNKNNNKNKNSKAQAPEQSPSTSSSKVAVKPTVTSTPISSSKDEINALLGGSGDFDQIVKQRFKSRKDKDEHNVARLRVQMTQLQNALTAEIQRRISTHQTLEQSCRERITTLESRLTTLLNERTRTMQDQLSALEERMDGLAKELEEMKECIPKSIEEEGQVLRSRLDEIYANVQNERMDRLTREGRILKQLQDHETLLAEQINKERSDRERKVAELQQRILDNEGGRIGADEAFRNLMEVELGGLKEQMEREVRERKLEDDALVAALHRYTSKLQATLQIISSVDD